mmetsp:Transcript_49317/g.113994  ORF Transcript_49317/g.113994 Transcript_49317/m.113994 type:complete len:165 (-) Transcript_49317:101-595(-)
MSRGLVNAIFASEARHPFWLFLFEALANRSDAGSRAATHVEIIRSTGPGLLRAAVEHFQAEGQLEQLGVSLIDARVWHPIMPEQKRGRDFSPQVQQLINDSFCYHHFVSSWMQHDRSRHNSTDMTRRASGPRSAVVPLGQSFRATNPWRSFFFQNQTHRDGGVG